jgi:hypothetical protein
LAVLCFAGTAQAKNYLPKHGKVFHGLTYSGQASDTRLFMKETRSHPAVSDYYVTWGDAIQEALESWEEARMRGMLTITAARGHGQRGLISPKQITKGRGDDWLLQMNKTLGAWRDPVYLSLFPEMNGHWNSYSAFNKDGSRRPGNSTKSFRAAWKRTTLIMRGGRTKAINRHLRKLKMHPIRKRGSIYRKHLPRRLPRAKVAMMWIPQSQGSPPKRGNGPGAYWPGRRYVDWVGADTFSKFPNFDGLGSIYRNFAKAFHKPMMLGEYAPWGSDATGWMKKLQAWGRRYARMLVYYQGFGEQGNPFRLELYPHTKHLLRKVLNKSYFQPVAPGIHTAKHGKGAIEVKMTSKGRRPSGLSVCRTSSRRSIKLHPSLCVKVHKGDGKFTEVPEGKWFLRIREGRKLGACWERPDNKPHVDLCGRVRVKIGKTTTVHWRLPNK